MGGKPKSLPVLSTESILRIMAVDRELPLSTESYQYNDTREMAVNRDYMASDASFCMYAI